MWLTTFRNHSIRNRLLSGLLLGILSLLILVGIVVNREVDHEVGELYDGELSQLAKVLLTLYNDQELQVRVAQQGVIVTEAPFIGEENYESKLLFQVWSKQGALLVKSSTAPETPMGNTALLNSTSHFENVVIADKAVRIHSLATNKSPYVIQVGQSHAVREELKEGIMGTFFSLLALVITLIIGLIIISIKKGLAPLSEISSQIVQRSSDNLEPVDLKGVPAELKEITHSLNQLFLRIRQALIREKKFTADASHELRTPLAGLKAQAQIALRDPSRVEMSLQQIIKGVDRTSRLANQLLALSKVESNDIAPLQKNVSLKQVIDLVCMDLETVRNQKSIHLIKLMPESSAAESSFTVLGDIDMFYMLLRNLLENALLYSPQDGTVEIQLNSSQSRPKIAIKDSGPGIAKENLPHVTERFYRAPEAKQGSGSGLGLAIVRQITQLYKIDFTLDNRPDTNGVIVTLDF